MPGAPMMPRRPSKPIAMNHISMTGPKMLPMNAVPLRWTRNRPTRIAMLIGTMAGASCGASSLRPSTALSTEIAGAHDQDGVFERDDHDQRPEDHRHDADDGFGRDRSGGVCGLLEPIERAGADIAVDDAECGESRGGGQLPGFDPGQRRRFKGSGHSCVLPDPRKSEPKLLQRKPMDVGALGIIPAIAWHPFS